MNLKEYGGTIALILTFILILSYSVDWIRTGVGSSIDLIFGPFVTSFGIPFYAFIMVLSAITGLYSSLIQKYTIDYERMQRVQKKMKAFQRQYREAQLSGDEKKIRKLEAKKNRLMEEQLEMSRQQFKPMAYIMLITVPIFFWLLYRLPPYDPASFVPTAQNAIAMPFLGINALQEAALGPVPTWILWYMVCSLTLSQVIRKSLDIGGL
ncbi:MAG: DUF106 domain-containing protein [Methanoculleaceae archaeon]